MACFPHPPAGTPLRLFVAAASFRPKRRASLRPGEPCPGGRGRDKRAMDGARPSQDMDVLPREKRLPADRARRLTGARTVSLITHSRRLAKNQKKPRRSEEHTSELQSLMRNSSAV